jgi:hypothetical protein
MNVHHPNPITDWQVIRRHPRPALARENPLIGFPIAIERLEIALVSGIERLPTRSAVLAPADAISSTSG